MFLRRYPVDDSNGHSNTGWFLCEGPYSRTDMVGLEVYHRYEVENPGALGTPPVDRRLFV